MVNPSARRQLAPIDGYHAADEPRCLRGRVSDPRPPDDGPRWPERDLDERRPEEPAEGWSDDPYRYEPPPPFKPSYELGAEGDLQSATPRYPAEHPFAEDDPFPDEPPPEQAAMEPPTQEWQPAEELSVDEPVEEAVAEPPPAEPPLVEQTPVEEAAVEEPPAEEPPPDEPALAEADEERAPAPPEPDTQAGEPVMAFEAAANSWDPKLHGNRRRPTTAEQAVPWLIGIILALTGMVIVLLALIFSSPSGLVAGDQSNTPLPSASIEASVEPSSAPSEAVTSPSEEASASPEPTPGPTPTPVPSYGPLEMVYLGRPSGVAPIYLLRRDFSEAEDPQILAQAAQGVERFAWSPDGRVGAAVISGRAVALTPGQDARRLADNVSALSFGWDAETVYAVRITRDGADDRAQILQVDFVSRALEVIANIRYPHPVTAPEAALREAQFIDDGGLVRIYAVADGNLAVWILGAPSGYRVDPADGTVTEVAREPILWSPDGTQRVTLHESGSSTTLRLRNRSNAVTAAVTVVGLVSHVRWAGTNNEIVFTIGTISANGGVRQDLYVWDLVNRRDAMRLTSNGASFGADWRGVMANWAP